MARNIKEYDIRYREFLDAGQQLFYQKGYELTSIQDIIDVVGVAKGLFYYYFRSKSELLDAIIERMLAHQLELLAPMVEDPSIDAVTKFMRLYADLGNWKLANRELLMDALRAMLRDENVLLRTKLRDVSVRAVAPMLTVIIHQGVAEGVFAVDFPDDTAEILLEMGQALLGVTSGLILAETHDEQAIDEIMRKFSAYERSMERVLGAPPGSLNVVPRDMLHQWFA